MGLAKLFGSKRRPENDYIDLGEYVGNGGGPPEAASSYVRVAEIHRVEDVKAFSDFVYKGNMLVLDFSPIAENEVTLRRVTSQLKQVVTDVGGDIAGFGKNMLLVTPTGVKVERNKARVQPEY
jgi:SepF-like predicted cell division protein (DUF552 family)